MLTRAILFIFICSVCVTGGSNSCPAMCTCGSSGREVDCFGKDLKEIPEISVSDITTLDISFNDISEIEPLQPEYWGMHLKFFYINNNHIRNVTKFGFNRFPELIHVRLDNNLITVIDPRAFEANTKLHKLVLNGNEVTLTNGTEFLFVPSLGQIELENCSISSLPVNLFKHMPKLVTIRLSNNRIGSLDHELFSHLKQLTHVYLEGNQIRDINPDIFRTNHKLQTLYLRNNPLSHFNGSHFLRASSLLALDVSFCNITQIPHNLFSNLHNLMSLKLNNNLLDSFSMNVVPRNLEFLDISGNSMTTISMTNQTVMRFRNIRYLALTNNNFTCECNLFDLWMWCARLRTENGGASSCDEFCPALNPEACGERADTVHDSLPRNMTESDVNQTTSDNVEDSEVEMFEGSGFGSREDANNASGKYRIEDENLSPVSASVADGKVWNIVIYSVIGVFGGVCLVGLAALLTDAFLGLRKSRNETRTPTPAPKESFRNVRLELMYPSEDVPETTPLSHHRGFHSDHVTTNAHIHS